MDNIFGIGLPELFFIAILALIILGPERLPSTLRQIARYWGYARNLGRELTSQFSEEFKALEDLNPRKILNELADEELAKDGQAKPTTVNKSTATAAKSTTTPKPPAKPTSTTANKASAAKTTPKPATTTGKKAEASSDKPATGSATAATTGPENTILPPKPDEATAAPVPPPNANKNGDSEQPSSSAPSVPPAEETAPEPRIMAHIAPAGLNGNADRAENEG